MEASAVASLNLKIIQKHDKTAKQIIFIGRHVVLYRFESNVWV